MKELELSQHFSYYKSMGIFPDAQGQLTPVQGLIWPNFEPFRDFLGVLITCKNEEDPIKNERTRAVTTLFIDFTEVQGQLTPKSEVEFCQNSNSFKLLWLVSLPARV